MKVSCRLTGRYKLCAAQGEKGFFKVRRGTNELNIEDDCWYAIPDVTMQVWDAPPTAFPYSSLPLIASTPISMVFT